MSQGIHNVKDIVGDALKSSRLLKQGIIKGNWEKIVGKDLGRKTYVVGVKDRVLYVNTENPVMLHQLSFMKGTMLEEVNKFLEMEYIKDKGEYPIFIIDDISSYFDSLRKNSIINYFKNREVQLFLSSTEDLGIESKNFNIYEGDIIEPRNS